MKKGDLIWGGIMAIILTGLAIQETREAFI